MTATGELITALVAGGMDAAEAAGLVARAAVEMTVVVNAKSTGARRQKRYRDRNKTSLSVTRVTLEEMANRNEVTPCDAPRTAEATQEASRTVTNRNEAVTRYGEIENEGVTGGVTGPTTKGFSLSPIPLLSPIPPNNPLTPKPSSKNSFGARDFGDWPDDFQAGFWAIWPHKVGKPAAMKALDRVRRNGVSFAALMSGVNRYIQGKPADRSWMNPATFLNGDRWEDQPASEANGQSVSNYRSDPAAGRATSREAQLLAAVGRGAAGRFADREPIRSGGLPQNDTSSAGFLDSGGEAENAH